MFTGLVQATGRLERRERRGPGLRLRIAARFEAPAAGESVAVNGVCLTVTDHDPGGFTADVSLETAGRTNLGLLAAGAVVNLERALRLGDRVGGHLVSGHVDAVVRALRVTQVGEATQAVFELPHELAAYLAPKGSVALDGVSLTVNATRAGEFDVMLIPHTLGATTLAALDPGRALNLEVDLLARYVVAALRAPGGVSVGDGPPAAGRGGEPAGDGSLIEALRRAGLM